MLDPKAKGDRFEREVAAYCKASDWPPIRQHDGGILDVGDFVLGPWVVECKSYANVTSALREGLAEAERAASRTSGLFPAAIIKRPGQGPASAYFAMDLRTLMQVKPYLNFRML